MTDPATKRPHDEKEQLKKMSFGDHLDELRRRLIWCAGTLFVLVGALLMFKDRITDVYMGPYRIMWNRAYEDFLEEIETEFAKGPGPVEPAARLAAAEFLTPETVTAVMAGNYPQPEQLRTVAGFAKPYPPKNGPGWDEFVAEFEAYATALEAQRDAIDRLIWHRRRSKSILAGDYKLVNLIYTQGGFQLYYNLVAHKPLEDFWTFMAASLLFACIFASPVLLWHLWAFIAAGLYREEKKVVYRTLPFSMGLLAAGVSFGYFVMVPYGFYFLAQLMNWAQVGPMFTVGMYFKFFLTLTFALGVVFQLPILMLALQKVGVLQFATLAKNWRWVVLSFFVIAAILTPPDPVTQILMVSPMITLFMLGLLLMWRAERKRRRRESAATAAVPSGGGA